MTRLSRRTSCNHNRGMALIMILAVITLLGTFMMLAAHLFTQTMAITRDGTRLEQDITQLDVFLRQMRADVWQAKRIEIASETHLELERGNTAATIVWHLTRDEGETDEPITRITRQSGEPSMNGQPGRFLLRVPVRVEGEGATIHLHIGEQVVSLASQHRLLEVQP